MGRRAAHVPTVSSPCPRRLFAARARQRVEPSYRSRRASSAGRDASTPPAIPRSTTPSAHGAAVFRGVPAVVARAFRLVDGDLPRPAYTEVACRGWRPAARHKTMRPSIRADYDESNRAAVLPPRVPNCWSISSGSPSHGDADFRRTPHEVVKLLSGADRQPPSPSPIDGHIPVPIFRPPASSTARARS